MKPRYFLDCPDYLKDYLTYIRVVRNYTEGTQNAYYCDLRLFLRYLKVINGAASDADFGRIRIGDVPLEYLKNFSLVAAYDYMSFLLEVRHNSEYARFRRTTSLKRFYDYLLKVGYISENPIADLEHPKLVRPLPKYLTLEQSFSLLSSVDGDNQCRDFCIILLFLSCGMRLSELINLDVEDYSPSARTLRLFGKGRKERIVYLSDSCIKALDDYLAERPRSELEPRALFLSTRGKRISIRRVGDIIQLLLERAGLGNLGITTHKLRHTAATIMYESGVDLMSLKDILGHKSLSSTEIYTHLSDAARMRAAAISPFADVKNKKIDEI